MGGSRWWSIGRRRNAHASIESKRRSTQWVTILDQRPRR